MKRARDGSLTKLRSIGNTRVIPYSDAAFSTNAQGLKMCLQLKSGLAACVTQIQALLRWSGRTFLGFRLWCKQAKQPRSARNADS
jgi:hypothetical protein